MARAPFDKMNVVKVSELGSLITPDFQRHRDSDHINTIYRNILEIVQKQEEPRLVGCLVVTVDNSTGRQYLLDGNHRLQAYRETPPDDQARSEGIYAVYSNQYLIRATNAL